MSDVVLPQPVLENYHAKDALGTATRATLMTGGAGLLVAAVQNTVTRRNTGALGVFSTFGTTVGTFAGMGAAWAFVSAASANLREKEDPYNQFFGGFAAGVIRGLFSMVFLALSRILDGRSMPAVLGNGLFLGSVLFTVTYAGGTLIGNQIIHPEEGRWPTKEEMRRRFRRPYQETINEIGEGRGIYGPGYDERRKQRLKENYGIDVPEPYYKTNPSS